ncbi:hypothetical protein [Tropicibacter naphthalenivorans]|uniref:NADH dehydrogenase subunit E n=1 Tax=Tropicibacter naphthalenivorans TaxID=441103 RepID=A0A0P1GFI3_9RHOB|nr:hypothetical protein [Tropicibacter naphthalenivorans]CUH80287.1 NADH dehydrogenase subunit E [Tropicibacter naphthalenivorans]SMC85739.1 NADH-quinone oxidoreductase subunit E [Tropicibacter naphthalenivorans]
MNEMNGQSGCAVKTWGGAALMGLFAAVMLVVAGGQGVFTAVVLGAITFVLLGLLLTWLFCAPLPEPAKFSSDELIEPVTPAAAGDAGAATASDSVVKASAALAGEAELADRKGEWKYEGEAAAEDTVADDTPAEDAPADAPTAETDAPAASGEALVKPSKALAGTAELATRKGEWKYEATASDAAGADASADPAAQADDTAATEAPAPDTADAAPVPAQETSSAAAPAAVLKPSTPLAGEAELATRKGSWKYEAPAKEAKAAAAETTPDFDGDGVKEGTDEGEKPQLMDAPRDGGADNLKEIKGVGPKLEKLCHSLGVYHFDQIAAWTDAEVAWVDANLGGFKGRVSRDGWVEQAKILAAGGDTEFSKRVDKGEVY